MSKQFYWQGQRKWEGSWKSSPKELNPRLNMLLNQALVTIFGMLFSLKIIKHRQESGPPICLTQISLSFCCKYTHDTTMAKTVSSPAMPYFSKNFAGLVQKTFLLPSLLFFFSFIPLLTVLQEDRELCCLGQMHLRKQHGMHKVSLRNKTLRVMEMSMFCQAYFLFGL